MKKKKFNWGAVLVFLGSLGVGGLVGILLGEMLVQESQSMGQMLLKLALYLLLMALAHFLQVAIHEAGHLIFGLLTGYGFSSYRLGSLILIKEQGKLRLGLYKLAGTGGQCLMTPPETEKMPFLLYNLGGCILNLAVAGIAFGLFFLLKGGWAMFMLFLAVMGLVHGLANGLPLSMGMIQNDGKNALIMYRSGDALRAFQAQLRIVEALANGQRPKDMPAEWFWMPQIRDNPLSASAGVMYCNRLMDEHRFGEAQQAMEELLREDVELLDLHRRSLTCDLIYCELVGERRWDAVEGCLSKDQKRFMQAMATNITVLRTQYLLALYHEKNEEKATVLLVQFEKQAKRHPYPCETAAERELIALATERRALTDGI